MKILKRIYYAVMILSLIAGMYSGLRMYYIVFFTQLFIAIAVLIINFWTAQTFKFKQELSRNSCVKGKEVTLHLEIFNEKPFPLSLIEVNVDVVSFGKNVRLVFSLAPYTSKKFTIPIATPYRGQYNIGMTKLKITDIFGLVTFPFDMRRLSYYRIRELIVLPKAEVPGTVLADIVDTKLFGNAYLKQAEQGDSITGARLYHEGDTLKRVHWKKSAQQGELFVKQYDFPERERILIFVDISAHGLKGEELLIYADTICECAACIVLHSLLQNRLVRMVNSAGYGKPVECSNISGFENLRIRLATLPFEDSVSHHSTLSGADRGSKQEYAVFVLTRGDDSALIREIENAPEVYRSLTMVIVGGSKINGHIHAIYVEPGSSAAESLGSIFQ